ncbi:MAG: hypothetical protein FWG19_02560 [Methanomassiliicoccaceae archaeon]|nr:hypothetical protein [Methanomassiliicoccaceae archaeon]
MFSVFKGQAKRRDKNDKSARNTTIGIDQSGTLGTYGGKSKYHTMVATVIRDYRDFEKIADSIPKKKRGGLSVSNELGRKARRSIHAMINEHSPEIYVSAHPLSSKIASTSDAQADQYTLQVGELLELIFSRAADKIFDVLLNSNSLITKKREKKFLDNCNTVAKKYGKEIQWIEMQPSQRNKVLCVVDFPANVVAMDIEYSGREHESHDEVELTVVG